MSGWTRHRLWKIKCGLSSGSYSSRFLDLHCLGFGNGPEANDLYLDVNDIVLYGHFVFANVT